MSSLPWFLDLTFQVPMQYCSLQHRILLSSPDTFTTEHHFRFGPAASFFLGLLGVLLCSFQVAYWTPSDLRTHFSVSYLPVLLYSSWDSHGKYTGVVCHSLLQWITFCQNSLLWPIRLGWPYTTWLRASSGYASPCSMTRHWSMKGIYSRRIRSRILKRYWHLCLWQHCTTAKRWKQSTIHLWTDEWIKKMWYKHSVGLPWWSSGWESTCWCGDHGFDPCSGKIPHTLGQLSLGCHNYQVSAPSHLCSTREGTEIRSMHHSKK